MNTCANVTSKNVELFPVIQTKCVPKTQTSDPEKSSVGFGRGSRVEGKKKMFFRQVYIKIISYNRLKLNKMFTIWQTRKFV